MIRKIFKWLGIILGILVGLVIVVLAWVFFNTEARINKVYEIPLADIDIPSTPPTIDRQYPFVVAELCKECHGENYGGQVMEDDPMIGRLVAPNLTSGKGGVSSRYTNSDWALAIRQGIRRDGKSLIAMPSSELNILSDTDLGIVISVIKNSPPVDNELTKSALGPMGRVFLLQSLPILSAEHIDHNQPVPQMPEPGVSVEYGRYLAAMCAICHGKDYSGTNLPGSGVNLTPGGEVAAWDEADFFNAIRSGVKPNGTKIDEEMMPYNVFGKLNDEELHAIWLFLNTLPAVVSPTATPTE